MAAAAGSVAWNAVSKHATAGTAGSASPTAAIPASAAGWCRGARSVSSRRAPTTSSSTSDGLAEALAAVHDAMADSVGPWHLGERRAERAGVVGGQVALGLELVSRPEQPQLQAARARVDDEDPH